MTRIPATLIEGDGIGPEITAATLAVLDALGAPFDWDRQLAGLKAAERDGDPLPQATIDSLQRTRLALKAPLHTPPGSAYRSATVRLRETFDLYANLRPARTLLPNTRFGEVDLIVVRENTEGMYVGHEHFIRISGDPHAAAEATGLCTRQGAARIMRFACEQALRQGRRKVTVVHKASVLRALSGLFREVALEVGREYGDQLEIDECIVDACAMRLVQRPQDFDVIVSSNLFGDILSDLAAGLIGGLGLAPGANLGPSSSGVAIFEAVHGSAPDIAGQGIANPCGLLLSAALMLDHVGETERAAQLRRALQELLVEQRVLTRDLGGNTDLAKFTSSLIKLL